MKCKTKPNKGKNTRSVNVGNSTHARLYPKDCDNLDRCVAINLYLGSKKTGFNKDRKINRSSVAAFCIKKELVRLNKLKK